MIQFFKGMLIGLGVVYSFLMLFVNPMVTFAILAGCGLMILFTSRLSPEPTMEVPPREYPSRDDKKRPEKEIRLPDVPVVIPDLDKKDITWN